MFYKVRPESSKLPIGTDCMVFYNVIPEVISYKEVGPEVSKNAPGIEAGGMVFHKVRPESPKIAYRSRWRGILQRKLDLMCPK